MRFIVLPLAAVLSACGQQFVPEQGADEHGFTAPSEHTVVSNIAVAESLPLADQQDFEDAKRGLIAQADSLKLVRADDGRTVWNMDAFGFLNANAPASVNPSLWRQAQLNSIHGLFKVADGIYQVRGYDLANLSIIEGDKGWILVDPLTSKETAKAAIDFARQHLGEKPITAVIFTHSHIDHFGGIDGVMAYAADDLRLIAPVGFMEEATSENVMAGVPMQRRASYMFGRRLPRSERGHIDTGLGKEPPFTGSIGIQEPTEIIDETGQRLVVDGVEIVFQNAPGSEAPAELTFYLPKQNAFCGGEVVSRNMHNLYTLRGAKVRDALKWSNYIDEALQLFGRSDVYFGTHQWPMWGNESIRDFMKSQRDMYKYLHDQTLRMASWGATPNEIADSITMPPELQSRFASRGYYGTPMHNSRAVYQRYFGWYDGNPANLHPLPETQAGKKFVDYMGGADAIIDKAQADYEDGQYRWVAQVLNKLVFAESGNHAAKNLLAKAYDQLGYQAESGPWRDVYLSAAFELRHGGPEDGVSLADAVDLVRSIPLDKFFDSMAARINPDKVEGKKTKVVFTFSDLGESYSLWLENSVLHHKVGRMENADAELTLTHELFVKMVTGEARISDTLLSDDMNISGSHLKLLGFLTSIEKPEGKFAIVTPE
ncbi:MAG: alkyl sulfatase BDS1-like metallo-beta-lactamase superfamily hydrolase [Arenicella sp.]|jgi:alkyl sulfatase BDS1-like metallo-beta-lactamase superfamily hydrolase